MRTLEPQFLTTGLLIIDVQRRLIDAMPKSVRPQLGKNIANLIALMGETGGAIVVTEQYPQGLGPTITTVADELPKGVHTVTKMAFNCFFDDTFVQEELPRLPQHVIVTGIEAHICVLQTVSSMLARGHKVFVPVDAMASRTKLNWRNAINLMREEGATITNTETLIFQYLRRAGGEVFKRFSERVR